MRRNAVNATRRPPPCPATPSPRPSLAHTNATAEQDIVVEVSSGGEIRLGERSNPKNQKSESLGRNDQDAPFGFGVRAVAFARNHRRVWTRQWIWVNTDERTCDIKNGVEHVFRPRRLNVPNPQAFYGRVHFCSSLIASGFRKMLSKSGIYATVC